MTASTSRPITIPVDADTGVSALLDTCANPKAMYVLAHGAGAGMKHSFMEAIATGLLDRDIASLRYQFPYMESGSRRPDPPQVCHATVRAAVQEAARLSPNVPLYAGGKSFGGRMTSQAQASSPLPGVRGLLFLGFPLHAAKKPSDTRAAHLADVKVPMLFLQGTRDEFADLDLLEPVTRRLGSRATLERIDAADHGFHVLVRSGRTDEQVLSELLDKIAAWIAPLSNNRRT
jgi:predicted alpha/beta-hydrolase family hydrolase